MKTFVRQITVLQHVLYSTFFWISKLKNDEHRRGFGTKVFRSEAQRKGMDERTE